MKKFLMMLLMFFLIVPVFASDGGSIDVSQYFVSLSVLAPIIVLVTEFIKTNLKISNSQIISWIVAVVLSGVGWLLKLGMFAGVEWYWILIYGFASGLVANGIFDITIIQGILNLFKKK